MINAILIILILITNITFSQSTFHLLDQATDARTLSLTKAITATPSNYININPANINLNVIGLRISNIILPADIQINEVAFTTHIKKIVYIGRVKTADYGLIKDGNNNISSANDIALEIGFKSTIKNLFSSGITVGIINSKIASKTATGIFSNIGISFKILNNHLGIGMSLNNLGMQIKQYNMTSEPIPSSARIGLFYKPKHLPASLNFDLVNNLNDKLEFIGGIEFKPQNHIIFRISIGDYHSDLSTGEFKLDLINGISFGAGFLINNMSIDYGTQNIGIAGLIHCFSISWNH